MAKMGQKIAFSMLIGTQAFKKYTTAGSGGSDYEGELTQTYKQTGPLKVVHCAKKGNLWGT